MRGSILGGWLLPADTLELRAVERAALAIGE